MASLVSEYLDGGEMIAGDRWNPGGYFENRYIREQIIKPYLINCGADPLGQKAFPRTLVPWTYEFDVEFYKDCKLALIWEALPEAKWIVVRRPDDEIMQSCERTPFMDVGLDWLEKYKERLDLLEKCCNVYTVNIHDINENDLRRWCSW